MSPSMIQAALRRRAGTGRRASARPVAGRSAGPARSCRRAVTARGDRSGSTGRCTDTKPCGSCRPVELEADVVGLELMARAGYGPRLASNVWAKMQSHGGSSKTDFFSTHPNHEKRVAGLDSSVDKVLPLYVA